MIKFNLAAANQLSTPDDTRHTIPNADWFRAFLVDFDGQVTGDVTQYFMSTGAFAASGSLNVVFYGAGVAGTTLQSRVAVYSHTLANANAPALLSASQYSSGKRFFFLQRVGGTAYLYSGPVLANRPIDGSALTLEASTTNVAIIRELDGSGLMFGSRLVTPAGRYCDQSMCEFQGVNQSLTLLQMARLCYGEKLSDLGISPLFYVRGSSVNDIADRGPNAFPFTLAGSPTTSADPQFGYDPTQPPQPDPDAVTVDNSTPVLLVGSEGTSATVTFAGAYSGTQPTAIDVRVIAPDGVAGAWVALSGATIAGGSYSGVRSVPDGGPYTFQARSRSSSTALAQSAASTAVLLVGDAWINCGSSSSEYLFTDKSGTGYTVAPDTAVMSGTAPAWSAMSSTGAATRMADELATVAGKPIGWLNYGVAGTTLNTWNSSTSTHRQNLARAIAAVKGKIRGAYVTVGANDAANGTITSSAAHLANAVTFIDTLRSLTGVPDLLIVWVGSPPREALNPVQADRLRQAESQISRARSNVVFVQALQFDRATDNVHLGPGLGGYAACGSMAMYQAGRAFYNGETAALVAGPLISAFTYTGTRVRVAVTTRDGTNFNPAAPGGFSVQNKQSDGSYVTLSDLSPQRINAGLIEIECGVTLVDPIVKYLSGSAPSAVNAIYSNGSLPLPMTVETEMVATSAGNTYQVQTDFPLSWAIEARQPVTSNVQADFALSWEIKDRSTGPMQFTPSVARTLRALAADGRFEGGPYWDLSVATRPVGRKDPHSVIDITVDWADVLADVKDGLFSLVVLLNGLTDEGSSINGTLTTVFVGGGNGPTSSITFRIKTLSNPARVEDRTVYLTIGDQ